jgi:hypothetical protein
VVGDLAVRVSLRDKTALENLRVLAPVLGECSGLWQVSSVRVDLWVLAPILGERSGF